MLYLVTALTYLKMDDFSHDWRSGGWNSEVGWFVSCGELGCVEERGSMQYVVRGRTVEERQCLCVRGEGEEYFLDSELDWS